MQFKAGQEIRPRPSRLEILDSASRFGGGPPMQVLAPEKSRPSPQKLRSLNSPRPHSGRAVASVPPQVHRGWGRFQRTRPEGCALHLASLGFGKVLLVLLRGKPHGTPTPNPHQKSSAFSNPDPEILSRTEGCNFNSRFTMRLLRRPRPRELLARRVPVIRVGRV